MPYSRIFHLYDGGRHYGEGITLLREASMSWTSIHIKLWSTVEYNHLIMVLKKRKEKRL